MGAVSSGKTGAKLDKFLVQPGNFILDEWLSTTEPTGEANGHQIIDLDKEFYPAHTFPEPWIGDHHPVLLGLRVAEKPPPDTTKQRVQIKVKDLTEEECSQKNDEVREFIHSSSSKLETCVATSNTARFVDILLGGLRRVFKANYNKRRKSC